MALISKTFGLDITPGAMPPVIHVSEYDVNREFTIYLQNAGVAFTPATGTTAKIEGTLNGFGFSEDATISGNAVTFTLTESMTASAGKAWVKVKLTKDDAPVSSAAFILDCDRAGVEADTVIGASGFCDQIQDAVDAWLDENPGVALTEGMKQALLNCFAHVAWIDDNGQDYYDALEDALYPPTSLQSISAVFTQGSAVIYDTTALNLLKQYLVVTAYYDNQTTETLNDYEYSLSGTLTAGTSTVTVSYGGKTTTFTVTVTHNAVPSDYQRVEWIANSAQSYIQVDDKTLPSAFRVETKTKLAGYNTNSTYGNILAVFQRGASTYGVELAYKKEDSTVVMFMGAQSVITPSDVNAELVIGAVCDGSKVKVYLDNNGTRTYGIEQSVTREYNTNDYGLFYAGTNLTASVNQFVGRMYWFRLYDGSDNLLAEYIPCYRRSDNVIGMYDTVAEVFYTNDGSGTFTKGADV